MRFFFRFRGFFFGRRFPGLGHACLQTKALPLSALAIPVLMANLREQSSTANITLDCKVTKVIYAGDEGGVICHLAFDEEDKEEVFLVSVTHLPVARKIAAY